MTETLKEKKREDDRRQIHQQQFQEAEKQMGKCQMALQMGEDGNTSLCLDEQAHSEPGKGPKIEEAPDTSEA